MAHWKEVIRDYIEERIFLFILVGLLFVMGIVFGSLSVNSLGDGQKLELTQYLRMFFDGFRKEIKPVTDLSLTKSVIINNLKIIFFMFVLGISVIGVPLILFLVFTKGFILGFTIGFILQQMSGKGFIFILTSIFPHYILIVPAIIMVAVANIDFAGILLKSRWGKINKPVSPEFIRCLGLNGIGLSTLALAGLVEGLLSPLFIYWVAKMV